MSKQIAKKKLTKKWGNKMPTIKAPKYPVNDTERALRFAKKYVNELKYVQAWKRWLLWDGEGRFDSVESEERAAPG